MGWLPFAHLCGFQPLRGAAGLTPACQATIDTGVTLVFSLSKGISFHLLLTPGLE